jgi:hypothetical protein
MKAVLIKVLATASLFAAKDHVWKIGTVDDTAIETRNAGTRSAASGGVYGGYGTAQASTVNLIRESFGMVVSGEGYGFMVRCPMHMVRHLLKAPEFIGPTVTIHGPIKYALEKGSKFFIQDEDGQVWEMNVMKKQILPVSQEGKK